MNDAVIKNKVMRLKLLVNTLNKYRNAYYNNNESLISDKEYDKLYDELLELEKETGVILSGSPTITVGYEVKSELNKVEHNHPMLSLDKTKDVNDIIKFLENQDGIAMLKMDGLTISLRYKNGELVSAETRGNGIIGEDVLHNAKAFINIPMHIDTKEEIIVDGEAIIKYDTFEKINSTLSKDNKYRNPRNLASGSVRQLDSSIAAQRGLYFVAWKLVKSDDNFERFSEGLRKLNRLGFRIVPYYTIKNNEINEIYLNDIINNLKLEAKNCSYPIDGIVFGYNDITYSNSLGATSHHLRSQIAFKFYDEEVETTVKKIDWTMGKTGILTPTVVFEPVEIDGTIIERASVHNVSILEELELCEGDIIEVYKANQIIPQVKRNISAEQRKTERIKGGIGQLNGLVFIPERCPICGNLTETETLNNSTILKCTNPNCKGKLLGKLSHFVSKNAINIDGLSESTLDKFIELGFINTYKDIYNLKEHYNELITLDGFGKRSIDKLLASIEKSRNTTLDRFINALSIPLIGRTASKTIADDFLTITKFLQMSELSQERNDIWLFLNDFGNTMNSSIQNYMKDNFVMVKELSELFMFEEIAPKIHNDNISNKTFVITGSVNIFTNRNEVKEKIESLGGKVAGSVSKNTDYLINNDINSTSSKNKKAKDLSIPIITEAELVNMMK